MIFYRIEYKELGYGCYIKDSYRDELTSEQLDFLQNMCDNHSDNTRESHPTPDGDGICYDKTANNIWLHGCQSINSLANWFYEYGNGLIKYGFNVTRHQSTTYHIGRMQGVFISQSKEIIDPKEFLSKVE